MPELAPTGPQMMILFLAHCLIGGIATLVAHRKGHPLGRWLAIGLIGGTPAFVASLLIKPTWEKTS